MSGLRFSQFPQYSRDLGLPGVLIPQLPSGAGTSTTTLQVAARASYGRFILDAPKVITLAAFITQIAATNNDPFEIAIYDGNSLAQLATTGATLGKLNATAGVQTIPLAISLAANTVYYCGCMCLTIGGTSATFTALGWNGVGASDVFGTSAPKKLIGFQSGVATALPNPAVLTSPQSTMPLIDLRES